MYAAEVLPLEVPFARATRDGIRFDWDRLARSRERVRRLQVPEPSDAELMVAIHGGDPTALERLYDRHGAAVLAICLRILRDHAEG